jgi:hypothetical protein
MTECPRWRLTAPHYLNVPELPDGTKVEWEHKETARESGRTVRKLYGVPILLDPKDAADHNYPGEIIVCHDVEGAHKLRMDYAFIGEPTQEMEPLNAEAEAITESLRDKWINPVESLPSNMSDDETAFMERMMAAFSKVAEARVPVPNTAVPREQYDALLERVAALEASIKAGAGAPQASEPRRL